LLWWITHENHGKSLLGREQILRSVLSALESYVKCVLSGMIGSNVIAERVTHETLTETRKGLR